MRKGAGQRENVARALLLISATLFSFVDAVLLYMMITPSFGGSVEVDWIMIRMYMAGVVCLLAYLAISWKKEKDGNLLAFSVVAALAIFVIPVYAQAKFVHKVETASDHYQSAAVGIRDC